MFFNSEPVLKTINSPKFQAFSAETTTKQALTAINFI